MYKPKTLFLIDCLGAITSAFLLGVVLVKWQHYFGLPQKTLYLLSLIASVFAVCSFTSYLLVKKNWKPFLKATAFANLIYCCITAYLLFNFYDTLTRLGVIYFLLETAVILILAFFELKTVYKQIEKV
jgi:hypothetical protein